MSLQYFVTGTDTDVGKTCVTAALLYAARQAGYSTAAYKPVAAGSDAGADGLRNADALALQAQCSLDLDYDEINPVCLEPAIAPHIAAAEAKRNISIARLVGFYRGMMMKKPDFMLVEGAGGWRVPLNARENLSDLARELKLPVILVVGLRLGCLNHSLLSVEAILADKLELAGWVANTLDPDMPRRAENIATLAGSLPAPCLGEIPYLADLQPQNVAQYLDISKLRQD